MIAEMFSIKGILGWLGNAAGGFSVGVLGFVVGDNLSGNLWVAIIISAFCQVIFSWIANRPRMVTAHSTADISERQQAMTEWATLLKQNNDIHGEQIKACREENKDLSRKVALIRVSKNNVLDAYGVSCQHITLVESILKDNHLTIPAFTPRTIKEMIGAEDDEILKAINGNGK